MAASIPLVTPLRRALFNTFGYADLRQMTLGPPGPFKIEDDRPSDAPDLMFTIRVTICDLDRLEIRISNCPTDDEVVRFLEQTLNCQLTNLPYQDVTFKIRTEQSIIVRHLAYKFRAMTKRPYEYRNYRWQCPRLAKCLEKLEKVLIKCSLAKY